MLVRLSPSAAGAWRPVSPEILADILWATSVRAGGLEHIRAREGPLPGLVDVALFIQPNSEPAVDLALRLCRRAIRTSPLLDGWAVSVDLH